jgi:quercetin dioxygenase-like cupin family protein
MDMDEKVFPKIISRLPEADIDWPGVSIKVLQGEHNQVAFSHMEVSGEAGEHAHGPQWGIVVEGEIDLTINGERRVYKKGDFYYIPDGAPHSGTSKAGNYTIDFFGEPDRYKLKEK